VPHRRFRRQSTRAVAGRLEHGRTPMPTRVIMSISVSVLDRCGHEGDRARDAARGEAQERR
jgi:hypothetical protein